MKIDEQGFYVLLEYPFTGAKPMVLYTVSAMLLNQLR